MTIELMHSITHDGIEYTPGVHDLPDDVAKLFLTYDWAARRVEQKEKSEIREQK